MHKLESLSTEVYWMTYVHRSLVCVCAFVRNFVSRFLCGSFIQVFYVLVFAHMHVGCRPVSINS